MCNKNCFALFLSILIVVSATSAGAEGFFKGGLVIRPDEGDVSDRWLIDFGGDYRIAEATLFGFEMATAVYNRDIMGEDITTVPLNVFVNLKFKPPVGGARPFVGGGLGLLNNFVSGSDTLRSDHEFGFHFLGGGEFGSEHGTSLVLELQGQKGNELPFTVLFLAGIRF